MSGSYVFAGQGSVGAFIEKRLAGIGWVPAEHAGAADAAITYCSSQNALEDAYFEENGLIHALRTGAFAIDLSPVAPAFARELSAIATVNDISFIEAPLVIKDIEARDPFGEDAGILCFCASDDVVSEDAKEILAAIAEQVEETGAAGTAQIKKMECTIDSVTRLVARIEAESLKQAIGEMSQLGQATAGQFTAREFEGTYTVEMMMAEVAAVIAAAEDADLVLPQIEAAMRLLEVLAVIGGLDMRPQALKLLYCEESRGAAMGLDWKRAQAMFGHDDEWDGYDDQDAADGFYDDEDDEGFFGGAYGGYSSN